MKREFVQLAHTFDPARVSPAGWFVSEKLDGMRVIWDSGVSRGMLTSDVPWANTAKDERYLTPTFATGLWSRYGKPIQAPSSWLDQLPRDMILDGELYSGRGTFQKMVSTVKRLVGGEGWKDVRFCVFDSPPVSSLFGDGVINTTNLKKELRGCVDWFLKRTSIVDTHGFENTYIRLLRTLPANDVVILHPQEMLPHGPEALAILWDRLSEVTDANGEGLMLRKPSSLWTPGRVHELLKVKKLRDMEGMVVGYVAGKETALGSKLLGLMGSLTVKLVNGKTFALSGFTDEERAMVMLDGQPANDYLAARPGTVVEVRDCQSLLFPVGSRVTFRYREMTDDGLPKEARYWRKP